MQHVPARPDNVMRVGAAARIAAAFDGLTTVSRLIPNVHTRRGVLGHLHTLITEIVHMQSNLNEHKRVIRDAVEIIAMHERGMVPTAQGGDMRAALIAAWKQDVEDVLAGRTADHHGRQIASDTARYAPATPVAVDPVAQATVTAAVTEITDTAYVPKWWLRRLHRVRQEGAASEARA